MLKRLAPTLVCVVAVLAPLPFGSAEPFWGAVWCALLAFSLLIARPVAADSRVRTPIVVLLAIAAVWCLVVVLQYLPVGQLFSAGPGWEEAGRLLGSHPFAPKLAAYGAVPIAAVVPPLALFLALLTGLAFGEDPNFTSRIYRWVANAGLVYAGYSIFAELTNPTMLLWRQKIAYLDSITGTFVNHNTAATFFGTITIIWYLWALREIRRIINPTRWLDVEYLMNKLKGLEFFQIGYALAFLVALATTFMTRSRAGSLLTIAVLALVTVLYFIRELQNRRNILIGFIALAAVGVLGVELAGGQLTSQLETRGIYDAGRATTWGSALEIVGDHPWLGTGLGTFAGVFPSYRTPAGGIWGVWDHAHSTPIELMVEMGIPFSMLVFGMWLLLLWLLLRTGLRDARNRLYIIAGTGVVTLGTLHSLVDFPLQIPGFSIICGVLTGTSLSTALGSMTVLDYGNTDARESDPTKFKGVNSEKQDSEKPDSEKPGPEEREPKKRKAGKPDADPEATELPQKVTMVLPQLGSTASTERTQRRRSGGTKGRKAPSPR
jgi:O-antigen ligase